METENADLRAENERLKQRCFPSRIVMIKGAGHYVSEAVFAEMERLLAVSELGKGEKMDCENGRARLQKSLHSIATTEQVVKALGMEAETDKPEGFWDKMRKAAKHRFFLLCLDKLGKPLETDYKGLSQDEAAEIADCAEEFLAKPEFDYAYVRTWFLNYGQFAYTRAIESKRERETVESTVLRVLVVLEDGGAKYLSYGKDPTEIVLTDMSGAHQFPVNSLSEISPENRESLAKHFESFKTFLKAKEIKVLSGKRIDASPSEITQVPASKAKIR